MKCIICHEREATVRDRNNPTSPRKKLCMECHADRLKSDFINILTKEVQKNK